MILKNKSLDERCLEIYEEDMINGEEVLILVVYCNKVDNGLWQFPAPQIFNETIYNKYKEKYDDKILAFRNDCEGLTSDVGSLLITEIETLKEDAIATQNALNELLFMEVADV